MVEQILSSRDCLSHSLSDRCVLCEALYNCISCCKDTGITSILIKVFILNFLCIGWSTINATFLFEVLGILSLMRIQNENSKDDSE